jgi:hypothetical protein
MRTISGQHEQKLLATVSSTQPLSAVRFSAVASHMPGHRPFESLGIRYLPRLSNGQGGPCEGMREVTESVTYAALGNSPR